MSAVQRVRAALRVAVALGLLAGLYVLMLLGALLGLALLVAAPVVLVNSPDGDIFRSLSGVVFLVAGGCALLWTVGKGLAPDPSKARPYAVSVPAGSPLRALAAEVAAAVGCPAPTRLYVDAEPNASVGAVRISVLAGRQTEHWTVTVGAPLVVGLSTAELRAVLAHEFGHYAGEHTRFGALVYRGAVSLDAAYLLAVRTTQSSGLFGWLYRSALSLYVRLYRRVTLAIRRRQELEADRVAATVAGPAAMGDALRSVHGIQAAWTEYTALLHRYALVGLVPKDVIGGFADMLADPGIQLGLVAAGVAAEQREPARFDSHPSLARRLRALDELGELPAPSGTAEVDLTGAVDWPRLRPGVRLPRTGKAPLPVADWLAAVGALRAADAAGALTAAAGVTNTGLPGSGGVTLDLVLSLLEAGRGAELAQPDLAAALYALAGQYIVDSGRAGWRMCWSGLSELTSDTVPVTEFADLVRNAARAPAEVPRLRLHLAAYGIDPTDPAPTRAAGTAVVSVSAPLEDPVKEVEQANKRLMLGSWAVVGVLAVFAYPYVHSSYEESRYPTPGVGALPLVTRTPTISRYPYPSGIPYPTSLFPSPFPTRSLSIDLSPPPATITVKPGDTLARLACRYGTTVANLQKLNNLGHSTKLTAGRKFLVPQSFGITNQDC